ncbi:MAG: hypothetical protein KC776_13210 [Myxococcales bacterium]|nr:hypothetical protein [Myxococcales bacterium]MCB9580796.1 hypothetical protein [Polyangiaceae bacterium]
MRRFLVLALFAAGCSKSGASSGPPPSPSPTQAPAPSAAPASTPTAATATATPSACSELEDKLRAELAKLPSPCSADADCTCYVGGVSGVTGCGGISNLSAAKRIGELTQQHHDQKCGGQVSCAARLCQPACVNGSCRRRPLPKP